MVDKTGVMVVGDQNPFEIYLLRAIVEVPGAGVVCEACDEQIASLRCTCCGFACAQRCP